jgi:hypothetical protein
MNMTSTEQEWRHPTTTISIPALTVEKDQARRIVILGKEKIY